VTWDEPTGFLAPLFAVTLLGALVPIRIDDREDHLLLAIAAPVGIAILGGRGLVLLATAVLLAIPFQVLRAAGGSDGRGLDTVRARRYVGWLATSAACIGAGAIVGISSFSLLGGDYPASLESMGDTAVGAVSITLSWLVTMTVRFLTIPHPAGPVLERTLDPIDSVLVPYLLPAIAGFPLVTAVVALYDPTDPWPAAVILGWSLPVWGAIAIDVHRRALTRDLRREAMAHQRLAAIGEVSARIVHQSRHQVGLMGWSIHRLRSLVGSTDPHDVAAADEELDALTQAKDRLSELLTAEILHETVIRRSDGRPAAKGRGGGPNPGGASGGGTVRAEDGVVGLVREVCDQLRSDATRRRIRLEVLVADTSTPGGPTLAPAALRDVVFNLVDNAVDAASGEVAVEVHREVDGVTIVVGDDGPGVGPADSARVFEPFFTTKSDGTGMGLAIADAVVADLGGELRYERVADRTRFVVRLPR
jgi:signal transduction histidine kinase